MIENFEKINKIYFVGIGGIAMSAVACLSKQKGFEVLGSDSKEVYDPAKAVLDKLKIDYKIGYAKVNIETANADLYVLSAGEGPENPEVKHILEQGLFRCGFPELLKHLFQDSIRVVVTGTHGKTTTSGFLGHLLKNLDDSSFMVGGVLQNYQSNFYLGQGHYAVFEGDEYKTEFDDPTPKFQYYSPDVLVLTNLEYDHPDMFENFESMVDEFRHLILSMPPDGLIVYNADNAELVKLMRETEVSSVSFGIDNEADFKLENAQYGEYTKFSIHNKFTKDQTSKILDLEEEYQIRLPGKINCITLWQRLQP